MPDDVITKSTLPGGTNTGTEKSITEATADDITLEKADIDEPEESGVARVEAVQAIWGKRGRYLVIAGSVGCSNLMMPIILGGKDSFILPLVEQRTDDFLAISLAMMMFMYELDNTTLYNYSAYAYSSFNDYSMVSAVSTAYAIIFSVCKPPIAKISDVIGRGETYCWTISGYILAYIMFATAPSMNAYAAGCIFYGLGQSGTNMMNDIIISDITSARWRGFALGLSFFPFLIMPWVSAFIAESVIGGIGWRWGIGILAILMPFCASFIIITVLYYQRKAKKANIILTKKISFYRFFSLIDLGGNILLSGGFAMVLLPLTLASATPSSWRTPWIDALIAVGVVFLIALPFYEKYVAKHPVLPPAYFKIRCVIIPFLLAMTDSIGFDCTHQYLYSWAVVAHNYSIRDATFYRYTNGVTQCLAGIIAGLYMRRYKKFKWMLFAGTVIRLIGYGVMIRLRGANNSTAELFIVQLIQGIGSGVIQISAIVPTQIAVPHAQLAQVTSLFVCFSTLGGSIGAAIAGGIYTNTFKSQLSAELGSATTPELINTLYNSITGDIPAWGTMERTAINLAYSNVLRYMTYAAFGFSVPSFLMVWLLPNETLPEGHNVL